MNDPASPGEVEEVFWPGLGEIQDLAEITKVRKFTVGSCINELRLRINHPRVVFWL